MLLVTVLGGRDLALGGSLVGCLSLSDHGFSPREHGTRTRGNSLRLHRMRFRLDIGENCFTEGGIRHWNRLLRAVVESPSMEIFQKLVDVVF